MRRRLGFAVVLVDALVASSCVPSLRTAERDLAALAADARAVEHGEEDGVVLYRRDAWLIFAKPSHDSYTQLAREEAIEIRSERGLGWARREIAYLATDKLVSLRARTIAPHGSVVELDPATVLEDRYRDDKGRWIARHVIHFPRVTVGSILEWSYVLESRGIRQAIDTTVHEQLPVRRYELEIQGTSGIVYKLRTDGSDAPIETGEDGDRWRLRWVVTDVPARRRISHAPPSWERGPSWSYRQVAWRLPFVARVVHGDWADAVRSRGHRLYVDEELTRGFESPVDVAGCADRACRVQRAWEWVTTRVPLSSRGLDWNVRPLVEVVASGHATAIEKVVLLRAILAGAGVDASFAAAVPAWNAPLDKEFARDDRFEHLLLRIGGNDGLWLDPRCEHCSPGEVSTGLGGGEALVFRAASVRGSTVAEATWEPIASAHESKVAPRVERWVELAPGEDGETTATFRFESAGPPAEALRLELRKESASAIAKRTRRLARRAYEGAVTLAGGTITCDARAGTCRGEVKARLPGYASRDGDRLLVPVAPFPAEHDRTPDEPRTEPIVIREPVHVAHAATLRLPAGWVVDELPSELRVENALGRAHAAAGPSSEGVTWRRELELRVGRHPPAADVELRKLLDGWTDARRRAVVLRRAPPPAPLPAP